MTRWLAVLLLTLSLLPAGPVFAQSDKELRDQRNAAHKERQAEKKVRNDQLAEATRSFRAFAKALETEVQPALRAVDTDFELVKVRLEAEQAARVAAAETEFQKKWTALLTQPDAGSGPERLTRIEADIKAYSAELFALRREAAEIVHRARLAKEEEKATLLKEMDDKALAEAESLGLRAEYAPILAEPIGGELTQNEERWNEREQADVLKLMERNRQTLAKHLTGDAIRSWERANLDDDFQLDWAERAELQELASRKTLFNAFLFQPEGGEPPDTQAMMNEMAELAQAEKLIKIKYDQIRKENAIKRREARKTLSTP